MRRQTYSHFNNLYLHHIYTFIQENNNQFVVWTQLEKLLFCDLNLNYFELLLWGKCTNVWVHACERTHTPLMLTAWKLQLLHVFVCLIQHLDAFFFYTLQRFLPDTKCTSQKNCLTGSAIPFKLWEFRQVRTSSTKVYANTHLTDDESEPLSNCVPLNVWYSI